MFQPPCRQVCLDPKPQNTPIFIFPIITETQRIDKRFYRFFAFLFILFFSENF